MKQVFPFLAAILLTATVWAQSPEKMSYQAVIRNTSDDLLTNTQVGMQISILQASTSGTAVYVETQTPTTNANGLVSIEIGAGTLVTGDFATIDWANGLYFIQTETDPSGGTSYTITGTSQLLSVAYALHAKTAETVTGGITETDPVFGAWDKSTGISITESQISDLQNYLTSEVDDSETNEIQMLNISHDTIYLTDGGFVKLPAGFDGDYNSLSNAPDLSAYLSSEVDGSVTNEIELPTSGTAGDMAYWNGTAWVSIAATTNEGATLQMIGGVPTWTGGVPSVTNPSTGKIWMDRNLGASQVAASSTDADAYGDLYQWGRGTDGHQERRSETTIVLPNTKAVDFIVTISSALSPTDDPGHGDFITNNSSPHDWRISQNDNLWQGVSGINNPCPSGYRLPTDAEWEAERTSWSSKDAAGAFASPLKLPLAGFRFYRDGSFDTVDLSGYHWSSTVDGTFSRFLYFDIGRALMTRNNRAYGLSVRCLKD